MALFSFKASCTQSQCDLSQNSNFKHLIINENSYKVLKNILIVKSEHHPKLNYPYLKLKTLIKMA